MTTEELAALKSAVRMAAIRAQDAAWVNVTREQADFIGRMADRFYAILDAWDDPTNSFPPGEAGEASLSDLNELAGLCIGLIAMIRTPEQENPQ